MKKNPTKPIVTISCTVRMEYTFLMKLSLMALSEKLLPIPPYPPSSPPWKGEDPYVAMFR